MVSFQVGCLTMIRPRADRIRSICRSGTVSARLYPTGFVRRLRCRPAICDTEVARRVSRDAIPFWEYHPIPTPERRGRDSPKGGTQIPVPDWTARPPSGRQPCRRYTAPWVVRASAGASATERRARRSSMRLYRVGTRKRVNSAATDRPPTTTRPRGAQISPPSP